MESNMQPKVGDTSIRLPVTFDYKGGRAGNSKNKVILTGITIVLCGIFVVGTCMNTNLEIWQRALYALVFFYLSLLFLRFIVFKELYFSDIYEGLKRDDFEIKADCIWQIFDIDFSYPYTCYFKNGQKGIFVRMEKAAITGKADDADFYHYDALSNAYNLAHALNMEFIHIDYMDNVGNDSRLQGLYDNLRDVENPDMQVALIDIYDNLRDEMLRNYACFDIYVFLTRDNFDNFVYNVQSVVNMMLGGNYITYKVLDRQDIAGVCASLFNLHDFSVVEACENILDGESHSGVVPISVTHADGTVERLHKTLAEKEIEATEAARRAKEEGTRKRRGTRKSATESGRDREDNKGLERAEDVDLFSVMKDRGCDEGGINDNEDKSEGTELSCTEKEEIQTGKTNNSATELNVLDDNEDLNIF